MTSSQDSVSVGVRTLRGMAWAYGAFVGQRMLTLVFTALLARLLSPSAFGLVAMAMTFIMVLETLSDFGLSQALVIVKPAEAEERASSVFVYSVLIGAVLMLVTIAVSPVTAGFFREPELTRILPVLGSTLLIRSLGNTHYSLAQKRLDFRSRSAAEMADVGVRGIAGIVLALTGFGAWSLVLGYLGGAVAMTATLWALVPWRPRMRRSLPLGNLMGFGSRLTAVNLLAALNSNVDYLFVGRVLGTRALGIYTLGFKLPELLIVHLSVVAGRVLFPAFAAIDRRDLGSAFLRSMRYTLMLCLPLGAGLFILADPLVRAAFGPQWLDSVPAMRLLTLYALASAIGIPAGTIYKATGRAQIILRLAIPRSVVTVASIALFVGHGVLAVAGCQAAIGLAFSVIGLILALRLLSVRPSELLSATWAPVVAAGGMSIALIAADAIVERPFPTLLAALVAGGGTYVGLLWLLARDSLRQLYEMALGDRGRGKSRNGDEPGAGPPSTSAEDPGATPAVVLGETPPPSLP